MISGTDVDWIITICSVGHGREPQCFDLKSDEQNKHVCFRLIKQLISHFLIYVVFFLFLFLFFYYFHSLFLIFCKNHFFFISPQEKISFSVFVRVKLIGVISMLLQVLVHMAHIW